MTNKGYLICGRPDCKKRGFIRKKYKDHVQIPLRRNITGITAALDYNAKIFFRLHEHLTILPPSKEQERHFDIDHHYPRIIPFTPHAISDFYEFEQRVTTMLSRDLEEYYPEKGSKLSAIAHLPNDYTSNRVRKISREFVKKGATKRINRLSMFCLFCSISFAALRDIYMKIENTCFDSSFSNEDINMTKVNFQNIATCLIIPYYYTEPVFNKKYHVSQFKILKILKDSFVYGNWAASTRNSKNWLFCMKCLEDRKLNLITKKGKCPKCCNTRKKVMKLDSKSVAQFKHKIINDIRLYYLYYPLLIKFMTTTTEILNDPTTREKYLNNFKNYENQIISSKSTYLRNYKYQMIHYDTINSSKKTSHSLTELDILNTIIVDDHEYLKELVYVSTISSIPNDRKNKILKILTTYNYPNELIAYKIYIDQLQAQRIIRSVTLNESMKHTIK